MKHSYALTFPTYLTLFRLLCAPLVVPFFIVHYHQDSSFFTHVGLALLFLFFAFTDYLDGFFARKYAQESKLGAILDHVADKFLIFSACIGLVAIDCLGYFWAIVLIGREFFMMGLREIALEQGFHIPVLQFGKIKTALHMIMITWLLFDPSLFVHNNVCDVFTIILLLASVVVSWGSALQYWILFYRQFKRR